MAETSSCDLTRAISQAEHQKEREIRYVSLPWDFVPKIEAEREMWRKRAEACEDKWQELFEQRAALVEEVKRLQQELTTANTTYLGFYDRLHEITGEIRTNQSVDDMLTAIENMVAVK